MSKSLAGLRVDGARDAGAGGPGEDAGTPRRRGAALPAGRHRRCRRPGPGRGLAAPLHRDAAGRPDPADRGGAVPPARRRPRAGIEAEFRAALAGVRRIVRGPKPQARLRAIGLSAESRPASRPPRGSSPPCPRRTSGAAGSAVQLYPDNPNDALLDFLPAPAPSRTPSCPMPMRRRRTMPGSRRCWRRWRRGGSTWRSSPPPRRSAAGPAGRAAGPAVWRRRWASTRIAAVGPLVGEALEAAGGRVSVMPAVSST